MLTKKIPTLPRTPGTYVVVFHASKAGTIVAGRLGALDIEQGFYAYAGSARGPGGVAGRLGRHLRGSRNRHWHVDHLRAFAEPVCAGFCLDSDVDEHRWARQLAGMPGALPGPAGFGASDCRCDTHLYKFNASPHACLSAKLAEFFVV